MIEDILPLKDVPGALFKIFIRKSDDQIQLLFTVNKTINKAFKEVLMLRDKKCCIRQKLQNTDLRK